MPDHDRAFSLDLAQLAEPNRAALGEGLHGVTNHRATVFTWDYDRSRAPLVRLYEKAKASQWNATTDLDWSIDVDPEKQAHTDQDPRFTRQTIAGSVLDKLSDRELTELQIEANRWSLSQFLHGEQGALLCAASIVETVPWIDAKYYAASQVMDEARHVEVFGRYLEEKVGGGYQINAHLGALLDDIIAEPCWDFTYLGMQIMVEGLALAAFGSMAQRTTEPLLRQLLRYVMADEARHVAFGVLSLKEAFADLTEPERRERQEFAYEAAIRMRDRFQQQEMWDRMGLPAKECIAAVQSSGLYAQFRVMLFSKIVPNLKKLGLLEEGGWLRDRFGELGALQFEDLPDTEAEYAELDAVAADREASAAG